MCLSNRPKMSFYSKVPERDGLPPYLTEAMVTEMHTGVDLDRIIMANKHIVKCTFSFPLFLVLMPLHTNSLRG